MIDAAITATVLQAYYPKSYDKLYQMVGAGMVGCGASHYDIRETAHELVGGTFQFIVFLALSKVFDYAQIVEISELIADLAIVTEEALAVVAHGGKLAKSINAAWDWLNEQSSVVVSVDLDWVLIESDRDAATVYVVTYGHCTCPARRLCKHRIRARLIVKALQAQRTAVPAVWRRAA